MQSYMGPYLEKNIQAMTEMQAQLADQCQGAHARDVGRLHEQRKPPMVQGLMGNYVDQSKNVFLQMQEQMQQERRAGAGRPRHQAALVPDVGGLP